jgi:hypothetical protein
LHTKTYSEHLREAKYCGLQWRLLHLKPDFNEQFATNHKEWRLIPAYCNSKACPRCAKLYFNRLRRRIDDISKFHNWRFFTLTSINDATTPYEKLEKLEESFRELRKKLKRKFPEFQYIAVKELSPSGMWHYHGLWNIFIEIEKLSEYWQSISGAYRVHLEKVRTAHGAVNYIFKYCYKSITNGTEREILFNSDKRKFTSSRGLLTSHKAKNPYICEYGIDYSVDEIKEKLYNIISNSFCTVDDFSSDTYPYFDDLIYNLFYKFIDDHPPNLFGATQLASLAS